MVNPGKDLDPRELYNQIPDRLDRALEGLAEPDLDIARKTGAWTIRQIVHHIVDADHMSGVMVKAALGEPDCVFDLAWYDPGNVWANTLLYDRRPIAPALSLFRASRRTVLELLALAPGAWQTPLRVVRRKARDPIHLTVGDLIEHQAAHGSHHIEQILETRRTHGV